MSHHMAFEIFKGANGDWYWHLKAGNGQLIAVSGEWYSTLWGAERAVKHLSAAAHEGRLPTTFTVRYSPVVFTEGVDHD